MNTALEVGYREGVARWAERNLAGAVEILTSVAEHSSSGERSGWQHAAARALAQIALEADDPAAEHHLRRLQGTGVGDAQTLALRARHRFQRGDTEAAIAEIHVASARLVTDTAADAGSLMNGAMALIWCAEILAELGYADDASALSTTARARMARAGVRDDLLTVMLGLVDASIARLAGMPDAARNSLDQLDTTLSPDLEIQVTRERARMAHDAGATAEAADLYEQCVTQAQAAGYAFLERSILHEIATQPPHQRTDRAPIGQWDPRSMENVPEEHVPYALVIRLSVRDESTLVEFEDRVTALLRADPRLGYVDGTGGDGTIWEIFLDGDDADALWHSVRPLLEALGLDRYAEISRRTGSGSIRYRPGRPRS
jgi:hypothetical protein